MLTPESAVRKVTRNSSHLKTCLADDSTTFIASQSFEGEAIDLDTIFQSQTVDPGGNAETLTD